MTTIARSPQTEREERSGRIEWLTDLLDTMENGKLEDAKDNVRAAIEMEKRNDEQT